jgi:hypothetical protein
LAAGSFSLAFFTVLFPGGWRTNCHVVNDTNDEGGGFLSLLHGAVVVMLAGSEHMPVGLRAYTRGGFLNLGIKIRTGMSDDGTVKGGILSAARSTFVPSALYIR